MSNKTFVGLDITGFENTGKYRPVSRVTLLVDDENVYTAGDDTGLELTASCPHATQKMVNALLAQLQGYQYQSFTADAANLDPAAELGDGVTVNGVYSIISQLDDDGRGFPDISSPGEVALEEEYPAAGPMTQEFNRQLADTRSQITKTAEEIQLLVESEINDLSSSFTVQLDNITGRVNGLDGEFAELSLTLDGLTVTDSTGKTVINGSMIQTSNLYVNAANISGTLTANQINLTGAITWGDLDDSVQNDINDALSTAEDAYQLASGIELPNYIHSTYIGPTEIESPTIIAGEFYGNEFNVYPQSGNEGSFNLYGDTSASRGYHMLEIAYRWGGGAYVNFSSPANAAATWDFSNTYYYGYIDFSGADVTGLDGASGDTLQGTYCDILATRDINMETDNGDIVMSCNGGNVRIACNDGEFRIYVDGTTWRLDRDGWYS